MAEQQRKVLIPAYMEQFACIGSACEDTCCQGWRVTIDQATYKKYNKLRDPELKPLLDKYVKRNRSNPSQANYAKVVMRNDSSCPFMTEEKMCQVQLKLGESYLSHTCSVYPRITNQVNGVWERSATMSCPEAARLALLNPEGIEFTEWEQSVEGLGFGAKQLDTSDIAFTNKVERYFWELRIFTIQVLQNRRYTLSDRLITLGMFYQKLQQYVDQNNLSQTPQLIASYSAMMDNGDIQGLFADIPVSDAIQMQLLKELSDGRMQKGVQHQRYLRCFAEMLHGIQYTKEDTVEAISERYREAYQQYYAPFMEQHEYILENYLVNYVFKSMFPLGGKQIFNQYAMLIVHYAMIKLHLIGLAGFHKQQFSTDHVMTLIQSFARVVEHNSQYLHVVKETLTQQGFMTMAYMSILIRN